MIGSGTRVSLLLLSIVSISGLAASRAQDLSGYSPVATTETPSGLILALGLDCCREGSDALALLHKGGEVIMGFAAKASRQVEVTLIVDPLGLPWARKQLGKTTRLLIRQCDSAGANRDFREDSKNRGSIKLPD